VYPHPQIWRPLALMSALVAATVFATATITVAPGDTLSEIAERNDVTVAELLDWNGLDDPDRIFAAATLIVSAPDGQKSAATAVGGTHVVTAGDTLSAIAARFGASIAELAAANDLSNPDRIYVGQALRLATATPTISLTPIGSSSGKRCVCPRRGRRPPRRHRRAPTQWRQATRSARLPPSTG